ncbi:hypothetical protein [Fimbriimonas ginsengisoli]|nr:hypothetical protein [Fimbriimonas ginsengisoli]
MAIVLGGLLTAISAPAQTIAHWFDRQVHGTAAHITPRHHKPGEPEWQGDRRPMRIIRTETITRTTYRHRVHYHHHRRHHHWHD